jgi:cyclase
VVHMGDLAFNRRYPVIDRPGGASIKGWIGILETVLKDYPADAIYIFGHSNPKFSVSNPRSELAVFRDYLSAMLEHVQKEIAAGKTKDQVTALENFPNFPDFHEKMPNRLGSNLGVAYDELTAKG